MIVRELMNTNVSSIDSEATVKEAANRMAEQEIGSLVVTEKGKPVGIVTERDLLTRVVALSRKVDLTQVKMIMSRPLIYGTPDMGLSEAARFMIRRRIKKLPIAQEGCMIGILTLTDLCATQPDVVGLIIEETKGKLPKRFMKRLAKRYYKT